MKFLLGFTLIAGALLTLIHTDPAAAHVLITDTSGQKGAVLHVMPDDDPIAGKESTLFFDAQSDIINDASNIRLNITAGDTSSVLVNTTRQGTLVTATYVFPLQGVYALRYEITNNAETYVFEESVRVTRGATQGVPSSTHSWAYGVLVFAGALMAIVGIIAWNRRHEIVRQSKM